MCRAGQYLNTLYLNTVFKYIYCIYTLYLNTFFNLYLITVFKYFWSVFKYMYLNTFLHTPLNINNRSSVDWSANHGFKHFNAVTCCICLLLNNTYAIFPNWKSLFKAFNYLIYIVHLHFVQYNVIIFGVVLSTFKTRCNLHHGYICPSSDQYSICVSLSILKLDLNVKHWYKKHWYNLFNS